MNTLQRWSIAALCALAAGACLAGDLPMPATHTQGTVSYVTGGIGSDEADAFRAAAPEYNLRLTLSTLDGAFFADVKIVLSDEQGNVLVETLSDGPFVFFKVPPGKYRVSAEKQGEVFTRTAQVREKGGSELYFRWKAPVE